MLDFCALRQLIFDLQVVEKQLMDESKLTFQQASVLCGIAKGYRDPKRLARQMQLSPSRMTRLLDAVVKKGYVERSESPKDRRSVILSFTSAG